MTDSKTCLIATCQSVALTLGWMLLASLPCAGSVPSPTDYVQLGPEQSLVLPATMADPADLFGSAVAIDENTLVVGAPYDDTDTVSEAGSAFVYVRTGSEWTLQEKLVADTMVYRAHFGASVSVSGNTIIVGAPHDDTGTGLAYVFVRSDGAWTQQAKLMVPNASSSDPVATAVAVHGNTAVVSSKFGKNSATVQTGIVCLYSRSGTTWSSAVTVQASDGAAHDTFGYSLALGQDRLVVGSPWADAAGPVADAGAVYIFQKTGGVWTQSAKLVRASATATDLLGFSVGLDADTLVAGAPGTSTRQGRVITFVNSSGAWSQQAEVLASDGWLNNGLGSTAAVAGDIMIAGCPNSNSADPESRRCAYVFKRDAGAWLQVAKFTSEAQGIFSSFGQTLAMNGTTAVVGAPLDVNFAASDDVYAYDVSDEPILAARIHLPDEGGAAGDQLGSAIAVQGDLMAVGAPEDQTRTGEGSVSIFARVAGQWTAKAKLVPTDYDSQFDSWFGWSLSLDGNALLVGSPDVSWLTAGEAYVFDRNGEAWAQSARLTAKDGKVNDRFGWQVAMLGDTAVVTAPQADIGSRTDAGAAYVFRKVDGIWKQEAKLASNDPGLDEHFGNSVTLLPNMVVIGASQEKQGSLYNAGAIHVFTRSGSTWTRRQKILPRRPAGYGGFGGSIAAQGDILLVNGVETADLNNIQRPYVETYRRTGNTWTWQTTLRWEDDQDGGLHFGSSLAVHDNIALIGPGGSSGSSYVAGWVFARHGQRWQFERRVAMGSPAGNQTFGRSVAISADAMMLGKPGGSPSGVIAFPYTLAPDIRVQANVGSPGTELQDAHSTPFDMKGVLVGQPVEQVFTILNDGPAALTSLNVTVSGTNSAEVVEIVQPSPATVSPDATSTFKIKLTASSLGAKTFTVHVASNDPDEAIFDIPVIAQADALASGAALTTLPAHLFVEAGQDAVLAAVSAGTAPIKHQWRKNGKPIPNATAPFLPFKAVQPAHAGLYSIDVSNSAGRDASPAVTLAVWHTVSVNLNWLEGRSVFIDAPITGPNVSYRWHRDGNPLADDTHQKGTDKARLSITGVLPAHAGTYTVKVTLGSLQRTLGTITTTVTAKAAVTPFALGPLVVGTPVDRWLQISPQIYPVTFKGSKLPPGLALSTGGQLTGKPTTPGNYDMVLTVNNIAGTAPALTLPMQVDPLPAGVAGAYSGLIDRHALNLDLGGSLDITVAESGIYSGNLLLGTVAYPLTGQLAWDAGAGLARINPLLTRKPGTPNLSNLPFQLDLAFDPGSGVLSGTVGHPLAHNTVQVLAKRRSTGGGWVGTHTLALLPPPAALASLSYPHGTGYLSLAIASSGKVTAEGRLADNTSILKSLNLTESHQMPVFVAVNSGRGSLLGWLTLSNSPTALTDGSLTWQRSAAAAPASPYDAGFLLHTLTAEGQRYSAPAAGSPVLGMGLTPSNAWIQFTHGDISSSAQSSLANINLTLTGSSTAPVKLPPTANNPLSLSMVLSPRSGLFSGSFVLKETSPALTRKALFYGVLVPRRNEGAGYFILPRLSDPLNMAAILSGKVVLDGTP